MRWFFLSDLLDEGHRESVPGDDAVVHQLHKGRQSEGQQVSKTTGQQTHRDTQTIENFSLPDGLEHNRERAVGRNKEDGADENKINAATGLAEERQRDRRGERGINGTEA